MLLHEYTVYCYVMQKMSKSQKKDVCTPSRKPFPSPTMKYTVTSNAAAFLSLLLLFLLYSVISVRREEKIRIGFEGNRLLESRIR